MKKYLAIYALIEVVALAIWADATPRIGWVAQSIIVSQSVIWAIAFWFQAIEFAQEEECSR